MTSRIVQAELLDSLPHDHPDARQNRRDLRVINALMGNYRWLLRTLAACAAPGESILEIGAGTGELAHNVRNRGWQVDGLDLWPKPGIWPAGSCWHRTDLRKFAGFGSYDAIYGNLIFHQFVDADLAAIGARLQSRTRLILASEPERRQSSQTLFRLVAPLLGANRISLHDGDVSIAAGFQGDELPLLLGLEKKLWNWRCSTTTLGANRMIAWRRDRVPIPP